MIPGVAVWRGSNASVSINEVNLRWALLVLGWVTVSVFDCRRRHFISVCNQPPRSTQYSALRGMVKQELIKRWDSERELFFTTISHTYFKTPKTEPISFNKLDYIVRQLLRIKSWMHKSATEFAPCSYRIFIPWASRGPSAVVFY